MLQIASSTALHSYQSHYPIVDECHLLPAHLGTSQEHAPCGCLSFSLPLPCACRPERRVLAQLADPTPQQIYERFASVVFIVATPDHGTGMGGTGSIIRPDGLILTNAHVVVDSTDHRPYSQISIFLRPERVTGNPKTDLAKRFTARVIATSESLDLALLQTEQAPTLPAITFDDPATVRIGDRVLAIGHPEQGGMWTLTSGLISAEFENFNGTVAKHARYSTVRDT